MIFPTDKNQLCKRNFCCFFQQWFSKNKWFPLFLDKHDAQPCLLIIYYNEMMLKWHVINFVNNNIPVITMLNFLINDLSFPIIISLPEKGVLILSHILHVYLKRCINTVTYFAYLSVNLICFVILEYCFYYGFLVYFVYIRV